MPLPKNELPKTAAAYVRVSDDRQDEYSPDSQLKLIRKYATEHGYTVPDEYVFYDDGISGKSAKKRVKFNEMIGIDKQEDPPFQCIFVWKFSRFARNQEESIVYKSLLNKNGVSVISVTETMDESPFSSLIERIIEWMDEYYLIRLSGEVKRGMEEKLTRGEPLSVPPFGYDMINKKLVPNEDANHVATIFSQFIHDIPIRQIAYNLECKGVKTRRGNAPDNRFIEYILNNPVYIGKIRWSPETQAASKRKYDDISVVVVDGHHEAIIDQETWDKAQEKIKITKERYGKYQRKTQPVQFMLKGLLRCSSCGATLCMSGKGQAVQCHNYTASRGCHTSHYLTLQKANEAVINELKRCVALSQFAISPTFAERSMDLSPEIEKLKKRLARCREAYQAGIDTLDEYARNKKTLEARIKILTEQNRPPEKKNSIKNFAEQVGNAIAFIESSDDEKAKNEILRILIDYIIYDKETQSIMIYFKI